MKRIRRKKKQRFLYGFLLFFSIVLSFIILEYQLVPPLKEISHMQCKTLANQIIDASAAEIIESMDLANAPLLYTSEYNEDYRINTALINQFCSQFSSKITESMRDIRKERICIPLGAVTGSSFLSNMGPKIPFTLVPMGAVKTDYETDFHSVGINQINYKIWLHISMEIKIVNPLYQETLILERKIMLVDIVFSGKVPEHYFQMSPSNEYLLTE